MLEKSILLSIIIPVYNSEKYLEKCVRAVLDQTYKNYELILVDDASTDLSGEICDRLSKLDLRIKVLHHIENRGLSLSREDGFHLARGEWISFIDNDDLICPIMYERLMNNIDKGDIICIRGEDRTTDEINMASWNISEKDLLILEGNIACDMVYSNSVDLGFIGSIWGKIIKRTLVDHVLGVVYPYKKELYWVYMEDVLFTPFLFYYAEYVVFDNQMMYMHRRALDNLSSTLEPKEYHYEAIEAGDILLGFFREKGMDKAYLEYLIDFFMLIMSTWYKVWKNEKKDERVRDFNERISQLYSKFDGDIHVIKTSNISDATRKHMILAFNRHRTLWGNTIGKLYFEVYRKISYRNNKGFKK